jgi:chromosome partitioning protein
MLKVQHFEYAKVQTGGYAMILTVASYKGGVGKTTTAVHLAAYLKRSGSVVLIDGDPNRSATGWAKRGKLSFPVVDVDSPEADRAKQNFQHIVFDTQARPSQEDLQALADGCGLLVIPTTADALALDALMLTVDALRSLPTARYRVLLTMLPPKPSRDGEEARAMLEQAGLPRFAIGIRRAVAFQRAALVGVLVRDVADPRAASCWADYCEVGRELTA